MGFLAALILLLVISPFVRGLKSGQLWEAVLFTLVLSSGLVVSGSWRRTHWLVFGMVGIALSAMWLDQLWPHQFLQVIFLLTGMAFLILVIKSLMGFVVRAKHVNVEIISAAISVYLIFGLLWGLAYTLVAQLIPEAFFFNIPAGTPTRMSGFTAMYFSFVTLATVGYGDITPVADVARMLAMIEAMTGTLFVSVLIARLVCLYATSELAAGTLPKNDCRTAHPSEEGCYADRE